MNWTWIISGSIEHDFIRVWKFETGMDWQIGWVGKVAGILIVGLVSWVQYPVEAIFFCWFWNPVMLILYKNDRNVRSVNLRKTRLEPLYLTCIILRFTPVIPPADGIDVSRSANFFYPSTCRSCIHKFWCWFKPTTMRAAAQCCKPFGHSGFLAGDFFGVLIPLSDTVTPAPKIKWKQYETQKV